MFLNKLGLAAVALLSLTLIGSGVWFTRQSVAGPPPLPPAKAPGGKGDGPAKPKAADKPAAADKMTAILKKRVTLAAACYRDVYEGLRRTRRVGNVLVLVSKPEDAYTWSIRWLQAQRDLSARPADQLAAYKAHLERMTKLKKVVEDMGRDLLPRSKEDEAEWYRLEAELWLARAKAK